MRREIPSIAAMAALPVGSQIAAIALSPLFLGAGCQAFQRPAALPNTDVDPILITAYPAPSPSPPHRPGRLRRWGRLPNEAHDHPRGRTDQPATADPPGDPEESGLFV